MIKNDKLDGQTMRRVVITRRAVKQFNPRRGENKTPKSPILGGGWAYSYVRTIIIRYSYDSTIKILATIILREKPSFIIL
jgi:hypothetical protein